MLGLRRFRIKYITAVPVILLGLLGCSPNREALLAQAAAYEKAGDLDPAKETYLRILQRQPVQAGVIESLVRVTRVSDPTWASKEALEHIHWCKQLLRLRPLDRYANVTVGKFLMIQGHLQNAVIRFLMAYQVSDFAQERREIRALLKQVHALEMQHTPSDKP